MNNSDKSIYFEVFAHRGMQIMHPENTIESFKYASEHGFAIELDIRQLKCGTIVCFHDRYMKRLLSIPGRIEKNCYSDIKDFEVLNSEYRVPKLSDVFSSIKGISTILIDVKGKFTDEYKNELKMIISRYDGKVYFHTKNLTTYTKLKEIYGDLVYFSLDLSDKRFQFVKYNKYKKVKFIPAIDNIIVEAEDTAKSVISRIWSTFNNYKTRVKSNHFLLSYNGLKYQTQHRGNISDDFIEHSKESFLECIKQKKVIELDVTMYKGIVSCYHSDKISNKLGQESSVNQKAMSDDVLSFKEAIEVIDGKVPIIIDVKDGKVYDRSLEDEIMKLMKGYNGEFVIQSWNPLVVLHFKNKYPEIIRGQVGNSLKGFKTFRSASLITVCFILFYLGEPDYIVYDLDTSVYILSKFNKIIGLPVIGYTAKYRYDIIRYEKYFDNIIVEGNIKV